MKGKRHPMQTLGVLLRELRQSRNFTQERMAGQAHVTTRAIQYWESDRQIPHDVELENLLCALELTTEQRQAVYGLLPEPRSLRLLSRLAAGEAAFATAGRLPGLGDLIRAMRVRRGWTDEQFAREMQVARSTVLRWEATQVLPSDEDMTRLCRLLRASAEEETALQSRRLHPDAWKPQLTLQDCIEQFEVLMQLRGGNAFLLASADLHLLALKRQICRHIGQSAEVVRLLAMVEGHHGWWLYMQGRSAEACKCHWRALNLVRGTFAPEGFWLHSLNLLSAHAAQKAQGAANSVRLLTPWLDELPPSLHFLLLCDLAYYVGLAQRTDEAAHLLQQAQQSLPLFPLHTQEESVRESYLRMTTARVLFSAGRYTEAIDLLPDPKNSGDQQIHKLLVWAEMFLAAGEKHHAAKCLSEAQMTLNALPLPRLYSKFRELTRRL